MRTVALIPARSGSKRLANKNLLELRGRPLIAYTCDAALQSGVFSAVYINTDSDEIAAVAQRCGVSCPCLRPAALADDHTPTRAANRFLLETLAQRGERFDAVMVLQPTSPLRSAADIVGAMKLFVAHRPCAVVSVSRVAPASWLGQLGKDGRFEPLAGQQPIYRLNGAIYLYGYEDYLCERPPRKTLAYCMPAARGVDIDTREELDYARFLLRDALPA